MTASSCVRVLVSSILLAGMASPVIAAGAERRALALDDLARIAEVDDPQVSPAGDRVVYTVRTSDVAKDKRNRDLWLADWRQGVSHRLTFTPESESQPRWSSDGKRLGFLSSRGVKNGAAQLWVLSLDGGEAEQVTNLDGSVEDFAFSPDGRRVALIVLDADPDATKPDDDEDKTKPPIVIDRFYFKEDRTGYLGKRRKHLYVLDLTTRAVENLSPDAYEEALPSWSPDGASLAFVSKRTGDADRNDTFGIYVTEPRVGATPRLIATYQGEGGDTEWAVPPQWSPDGKQLAYVAGGDPKLIYYAVYGIAVVPIAGGAPRLLTRALDRNVSLPRWSADGRSLYAIIEDDGNEHLASVAVATGKLTQLTTGRRAVAAYSVGRGDRVAVLQSTVDRPNEVFAVEGGRLRPLSQHNDALFEQLQLGAVDEIRANSADGTPIGGFVVRPPNYQPGKKYPTLLRIHGGPVSQYNNEFMFEWQLFAANGYVVVAGNPRGSSGRGEKFSSAIYADWGDKDTQDVLALVDAVVAQGLADPERLGVGGWSYGGMLTNYVIATDRRFKAATSGASIANILAGYGTDMYVREYEMELGQPWKNLDTWLKVSFPFYKADRIDTPTMFLCGDADFNVPLLNSEQMYQALRSRDIPTQLVIYPGQTHGLSKPSYQRDRLQRYLDWYAKYLR